MTADLRRVFWHPRPRRSQQVRSRRRRTLRRVLDRGGVSRWSALRQFHQRGGMLDENERRIAGLPSRLPEHRPTASFATVETGRHLSQGERAARAAGWTDEQINRARQAGALHPDIVAAVERGKPMALGAVKRKIDGFDAEGSEP